MPYLKILIIFSIASIIMISNAATLSGATQKIVILGGGIHGASLAYFLAERGVQATVVERKEVAAAASGKAGGFLAREWGSGPTVALHRAGFDLHRELAETLQVTSYRQVDTLNVNGNRKGPSVASWLNKKVESSPMDKATAQVTPLELTTKLMNAAIEKGAEVIIDVANGVEMQDDKVIGVRLKEHGVLKADKVVICLGPWSGVVVEDWFGLSMPMEGVKSTSLVYRDLEEIRKEPYACFCAEDDNNCHLELYPRPNGEIYICGCGGSDYVSGDRLREGGDCETPDQIHADPLRVAAASKSFGEMSNLGERPPDVAQACMRPCTSDGLPVMGQIPGIENAYISAAHNCWGILWGPVSGRSMAELLIDGQSAIDLSAFTPARYMKKIKSRGRKRGEQNVGEQW